MHQAGRFAGPRVIAWVFQYDYYCHRPRNDPRKCE